MKIKGAIEDLIIKKNQKRRMIVKIVKNISKTFSGGVVGIVGSVHFQIVPWSGLYFSRSVGLFLCCWY